MAAQALLIPAAMMVGKMVLGKVLGGGKDAAQGALTPGPPNPHLSHPINYATNNTASYVAGRGFRRT
jgi:hypothetical protein